MRNVLEYPVTQEEVKSTLEDVLMREEDDDRIGSMTAFILSKIIDNLDKIYRQEYFEV